MAKTEDMNKDAREKLWYMNHDNIVTLIDWMAEDNSYSKQDLASAVEKPWKYEDEFRTAQAKLDEELAADRKEAGVKA